MTVYDATQDPLRMMQEVMDDFSKKLRSSQQELRDRLAILDRFALISETDTRGVIQYANPKFCEVSGYTLEELLGKPHNIVRQPDMPKEVFKNFWETLKAGQIWQGEIKNRRKDGSSYWVLATVGPVLDAEGHPQWYVSVRVDITHQKELAEEILQNLAFAAHLQKALMPPLLAERHFIDLPYFVLHKALRWVSGDFAWAHQDKGRIVLFVGDSIGHGVSGAFVSALFIRELRCFVIDRGLWSPELLARSSIGD